MEKEVIFVHKCCRSGYDFIKEYISNNPNVKIKTISMFKARDMGLHTKYNFDINDLHKYVYLIDGDNIITGKE